MTKVTLRINSHLLEVTSSSFSGHAKIVLDGKEIYSKWWMLSNDAEMVNIDGKRYLVIFTGVLSANISIQEVESKCLVVFTGSDASTKEVGSEKEITGNPH